jgi:hypothetical protein
VLRRRSWPLGLGEIDVPAVLVMSIGLNDTRDVTRRIKSVAALVQGPFTDGVGQFSTDGRWFAYVSDE